MKARFSTMLAMLALLCLVMIPATAGATTVYDQTCPATAEDKVNDQFLVAYLVEGEVSSPYMRTGAHIAGQFVSSVDGAPIGDPFAISEEDASLTLAWAAPAVASVINSDGMSVFLVAWGGDTRVEAGGTHIYGQLVLGGTGAGDHSLHNANFIIDGETSAKGMAAVAAWNNDPSTSRFMAAWVAQPITDYDIRGRLISNEGAPLGSAIAIADSTGSNQLGPDVATNEADSQFFVVFYDDRNSGQKEIYGQFLLDQGNAITTTYTTSLNNTLISDNGVAANKMNPAVVYDPAYYRYMAVWEDYRSYSETGSDIYGQIIDYSGGFVGSNTAICDSPFDQGEPDAAVAGMAAAGVVWTDYRFDPQTGPKSPQGSVYGKLVDFSGSVLTILSPADYPLSILEGSAVEAATAFSASSLTALAPFSRSNSPFVLDWKLITSGAFFEDPADGHLVGHWEFNDGSGATAADSTLNDNDGTLYGAQWTKDRFKDSSRALYFDGASSVAIPSNTFLNNAVSNTLTLSAWIQPGYDMGYYRAVIAKTADPDNFSYWLGLYEGSPKFRISSDGSTYSEIYASDVTLDPMRWCHLAGTYDGQEMKLYLNGLLVGSTPYSGNVYAGIAPIRIGSGGSSFFKGAIDDVRIYGKALNPVELSEASGNYYMIRGFVSATESPVAGARVEAMDQYMGTVASTETDYNGYYTMYLPSQCVDVVVNPPAAAPSLRLDRPVFTTARLASQGGQISNFELQEGAITVTGVISDSMGYGVESAVFYEDEDRGIYYEVETDGSGAYQLNHIPPGSGVIGSRPLDKGFAAQARNLDLTGDFTQNFTVTEATQVVGMVVDSSGFGVPGVPVTFHQTNAPLSLTEYTDERGVFTIPGIEPGSGGYVEARPDPYMGFCQSGKYYVTEDPLLGNLNAGVIKLQRGAFVMGFVIDSATSDPVDGVYVSAGGYDFSAKARTCNGYYSLVLPPGQHAISVAGAWFDGEVLPNWPGSIAPRSYVSAIPVTVTVTAGNVFTPTQPLTAPALDVVVGFDSGALGVVVNEDPSWDMSSGELAVAAYLAGSLTAPLTPEKIVQPPIAAQVLSSTLGVGHILAPLPEGELYDVYLFWTQEHSGGIEAATVLSSVLGVDISSTSVITFTLPTQFNNSAYGGFGSSDGGAAAGALVHLTDASGNLAGWTYSSSYGDYEFYRVPAGANYTTNAAHFLYGEASPSGPNSSNHGADDWFGWLEVQKSVIPSVTVIESHRVMADSDAWTGASRTISGDYHYQPMHSLYFSGPMGGQQVVDSLWCALQPGRAVENVQASIEEYVDGYFQATEYTPDASSGVCSPPCAQVCDDPFFQWYDPVSYYGPDTSAMEFSFVDSAQSTWQPNLVVTRTADVTSNSGTFWQEVTLAAVIVDGTPGSVISGSLDLRIYEDEGRLGFGSIDWGYPGMDEEYGIVDNESYNENYGFAVRSIKNPVVGRCYAYTKRIQVSPGDGVENHLYHMPRTRVRLNQYMGTADFIIQEETQRILTLNDEGGLGNVELSAVTPMEWLPGFINKVYREEVEHRAEVREVGAARPAIIARYPAPGEINVPVGSPISMTMDKRGDWGGQFLHIADQWGNALADSETGPDEWYNTTFDSTYQFQDTLVYLPDSDLLPGTAYAVTALTRDEAGYRTNTPLDPRDLTYWFATEPSPGDVTPPTIVSTIPYDGQVGVSTVPMQVYGAPFITVIFSEAILDPSTYYTTMWELDGPGGNTVGSLTISSVWMGNRITFYPDAPLNPYTTYRIKMYAGIEDLSGNGMTSYYQWEFTTGAADTARPSLFMPLDGATDVSTSNPAMILYADEELDPSTLVMGHSIRVLAEGQDVSDRFELSYVRPTKGVWIIPKPEYQYVSIPNDTVISITVGTQHPDTVTDLAGNSPTGPTPQQVFSFRTAPTRGNAMPSFREIVARSNSTYPHVLKMPGGVYLNVGATINDDYYDSLRGGYGKKNSTVDPWFGTTVTMTLGAYVFPMETYNEYYWNHRTYVLPPGELIPPGDYTMTISAYDTACHQAILEHEVRVYGDTPSLVSPVSGTALMGPVAVQWEPISEETSGYYVQFSTDGFDSKAATFYVPDDGRAGSYSLSVPGDLDLGGLGQPVDWRVVAMSGVGEPFGRWGGAVSEVRRFTILEDEDQPYVFMSNPGDGESEAPPAEGLIVRIMDDASGVATPTIQLSVDGGVITDALVINVVNANTVDVQYMPDMPWAANSLHTVEVYCQDNAGNEIDPATSSIDFTVRANRDQFNPILVPGDYPTPQEALDGATYGDHIRLIARTWQENLTLTARQSGIRLFGDGYGQSILDGSMDAAPVILVDGAIDVTISGFSILSGTVGVEITGGGVADVLGCEVAYNTGDGIHAYCGEWFGLENNLIHHNGGWGIDLVSSGDVGTMQADVLNNTIAHNAAGGALFDGGYNKAFYNIVAYNGAYAFDRAGGTLSWDYNCVHGQPDDEDSLYYGNYNTIDDPVFVNITASDPKGFDYRLDAGSAAIDLIPYVVSGDYGPVVPGKDIDGADRPQFHPNGDYDAGCYEMEDVSHPFVIWRDPACSVTNASPFGPWFVELDDDISGVNPLSVTVKADYGNFSGVVTATQTISGTVMVQFVPDAPLDANHNVSFNVMAYDYAGNYLSDFCYFYVRGNITMTVPTDFGTIQEALDSAIDGDIVEVEPGMYNENLVVSARHSGIALRGAGADITMLTGLDDGEGYPVAPVVDITYVNNFELSGFTLTYGTEGAFVSGDSDNILIARNIFCTNYGDNIYVDAIGDVRIENNLIRFSELGSGIHINDFNSGDAYWPTPVIVNNTVVSNSLYGIQSFNSAPVTYYNVVAMNGSYGFQYNNSSGDSRYNCLYGNGTSGEYSGTTAQAGDINEDPLFDPASGIAYRLMPDSPAMDSIPQAEAEGGALSAPQDDLLNRARPMGLNNAYDMGCYEEYPLYFTSTAPGSVDEGAAYSYQPTAVGMVSTWTFGPNSQHPSGMEIDLATGYISYSPGANEAGSYWVEVAATDNHGRTTYQSFMLTVNDVNLPPDPPYTEVPPPYYGMVNRLFRMEFDSHDSDSAYLEFSLANGPSGMEITDPFTGILSWLPSVTQTGVKSFQVQVSDEESIVPGQVLTMTVLPALSLQPAKATPLIMVTGAVTTTVAVNCQISGGMPPYSAYSDNASVGIVQNLNPAAGTFTFVPGDKGQTTISVYDGAGFHLAAGPFDVAKMQATLVAPQTPVAAGAPITMTVAGGDLTGLGFQIPGSSTSAPITVTIGQVDSGSPFLGEQSSPIVSIGPDGTQFSIPASLAFPYVGAGDINDQLVFTFNAETGRWEYVPDSGNDGSFIYVDLHHLSMYTTAEPADSELALHGGTDVEDYRMVSFPLYPAAEDSMVALLGDAANLGGYDDTKWRLFTYDPALQARKSGVAPTYVEGSDAGFDAAYPMAPGQAYWLISRYAKTVTVPGLSTDMEEPYFLTLQPGWNMIGNPFDTIVNWDLTESAVDGETFYYPTEPDSPLYEKSLFYYDPSDGNAGVDGYVDTILMDVNGGYWIQNTAGAPVTLKIPPAALSLKKAEVARKEPGLFARAAKGLNHLIRKTALAESGDRPPAPPGTAGSNSGTSSNSIGVASGDSGGGGSCFVDEASSRRGAAMALPLILTLAGMVLALASRKQTGR